MAKSSRDPKVPFLSASVVRTEKPGSEARSRRSSVQMPVNRHWGFKIAKSLVPYFDRNVFVTSRPSPYRMIPANEKNLNNESARPANRSNGL